MKKIRFLAPSWVNIGMTTVIMFLPWITERAATASGEMEVVRYMPAFLLTAYLQTGEYYPFLLMLLLLVTVYIVVSAVVWGTKKVMKKRK